MKKVLLLLLLVMSTSFSYAETIENISGELKAGYRILPVDPASQENSLTVYRGDYIKVRYPEEFSSLTFDIPDLQYSSVVFPKPGKSPFFKMKVTGTYSFTLGNAAGSITVIELVRPNYIEVNAEQAADLLANRHPYILDVRTSKEYQQVHISGAQLIPIQELQARVKEIASKKHEDIFIYCATGNRSTVAARFLIDQGFKRIYNLRYGVHDWVRHGNPYETGN